jgi:hypothetical protein
LVHTIFSKIKAFLEKKQKCRRAHVVNNALTVLQVELSKNNTGPEGNVVFVKPVQPYITEAPEAL